MDHEHTKKKDHIIMDLSKTGDWTRILWTTSHHANHYAMPLPYLNIDSFSLDGFQFLLTHKVDTEDTNTKHLVKNPSLISSGATITIPCNKFCRSHTKDIQKRLVYFYKRIVVVLKICSLNIDSFFPGWLLVWQSIHFFSKEII